MAVEPPPKNHHVDPSTSGSLGYFHIRIHGPAAPLLLLRSDRLYSLSFSRRRGHRLRLLASPARRHLFRGRRRRDLLLSTSGCVLRLTHCFPTAVRVNGLPLPGGGGPVHLAVGDEVSLLLLGARYGFVAEKFVSCEGGKKAAGSSEEVLVLRAESLRKRLRAISESQDPLSFLRDSPRAYVGVKKAREEGDFLHPDSPIDPVPEENLRQEEHNLHQDRLEHQDEILEENTVSKKEDTVESLQRSKEYNNDNVEHKRCSNGNVEQHHTKERYSDGSTFFLNRLSGIRPEMRTEQESGVTLPELLHPTSSLLRVFIATFTSDVSWFLEYCKIPQLLPVTIACHNKERCWSASRESRSATPFENHPNLLLVYPQFPEVIAFGKDRKKQGVACHHPKLIVLQREDSMRVIISSANLVPRQWHLITNTVWWQDFPRKTSPDYSALFSAVEESKSDFAAQLVSFIGSLINEVPSQAYWINEIAKYDFEGAGGYLVASVPGLYMPSPCYLESNYCLSANRILHTKSAHRMFLGSVQTSVVGLSHRFHMPSDAGLQLKSLSVFLAKCHENMHGTTEVILKRNANIPADANAVSVLVADLDKFSEEDSVQLGFLPREVAKWVSPLSDMGFFKFSGFIYPREALEAAFGVTNAKVQLLLYVSKGPEFSRISGLIRDEHLPSLCSLVASLKRSLGLWRLEECNMLLVVKRLGPGNSSELSRVLHFLHHVFYEVLSRFKWPETLETDFMYSASSIGTSINSQFIAHFASATGKRSNHDFDSEESDPEWGCWTAGHERKKPSISLLFPTIERVKSSACGIQLSRFLLSLPEKTWQRLRSTGIFHDAVPHPHDRIGHPMHVKVVQRRFRSRKGGHSFGWTYCGSHNFSPAAWGQTLRPPSKANATDATRAAPSGRRLHICNYELGIILIAPPPGVSKKGNGKVHRIDGISLPFVIPAPRYKHNDRPATPLAMREAMAEACIPQSNDFSEETDEDIADEDDELVVELSDCSPEEKEEEKIYAEMLWGQVDSSQSQGKDT